MNEVKNERKKWFLFVEKIMKLFIKKSNFVYLGEKITNGGIILSNHEGTKAPLALELYSGHPIRFWGTHEMNSGLKKMYAYQSKVFYHEKRHWNLFLARMFCLIASPLTNMFYKGLNLISTYQDARLRITLKESVDALNKGHNLVIYPEISDKGYLKELEGFHEGFDVLFDYCLKNNIDAPVFVSYYQVENKTYVFDKPIKISELKNMNLTRKELADYLCNRCNELGKMDLNNNENKSN